MSRERSVIRWRKIKRKSVRLSELLFPQKRWKIRKQRHNAIDSRTETVRKENADARREGSGERFWHRWQKAQAEKGHLCEVGREVKQLLGSSCDGPSR